MCTPERRRVRSVNSKGKSSHVAFMNYIGNVANQSPRVNAVITNIDIEAGVITVDRPKPCQFEIDERGKHEEE